MSKIFLTFLLILACCSLPAQQDTLALGKMQSLLFQNLVLKQNNLYYKHVRIAKEDLLPRIDKDISDSTAKALAIKDFSKFYKYKSQKNGLPVIAAVTFVVGALFTFVAITRDPGAKGGSTFAASVFGGAGVGFTTAAIISSLKFKKLKSQLSKKYLM